MQAAYYPTRKKTVLSLILLSGVIVLSACFHSTRYVASYTVHGNNQENNTKELATNFIHQLADKKSLTEDTKYKGTDTIGFYGRPYHYFKFWFDNKDSNTTIQLDYSGTHSSKKNPYNDFFTELNNFMNENFIMLKQEIKE